MQTFNLSMDNRQAGITFLLISTGSYLTFPGVLTLGIFSAFILLLPAPFNQIVNHHPGFL